MLILNMYDMYLRDPGLDANHGIAMVLELY